MHYVWRKDASNTMKAATGCQMDASLNGPDVLLSLKTEENLAFEQTHMSVETFEAILQNGSLRSLKLKAIDLEVDQELLMPPAFSPNLETLEIDRCSETIRVLLPLLTRSRNLKTLSIGLEQLDDDWVEALNGSGAQISLTMYATNDLSQPGRILALRNLIELTFVDFGDSLFPEWVKNLQNLKSLSFVDGRLKDDWDLLEDPIDGTPAWKPFPLIGSKIRRLSLCCKADRIIVDNLLQNGKHLKELTLSLMPDFSLLGTCVNLQALRIRNKELDDEIFSILSERMNHLRVLYLGGFINLANHHIEKLKKLKRLEHLALYGVCMPEELSAKLAALPNLTELQMHAYFYPWKMKTSHASVNSK